MPEQIAEQVLTILSKHISSQETVRAIVDDLFLNVEWEGESSFSEVMDYLHDLVR